MKSEEENYLMYILAHNITACPGVQHTSGYPGHAYVNVYILWVYYYHTLLAEIYVYVHVYVLFYFNLLAIV